MYIHKCYFFLIEVLHTQNLALLSQKTRQYCCQKHCLMQDCVAYTQPTTTQGTTFIIARYQPTTRSQGEQQSHVAKTQMQKKKRNEPLPTSLIPLQGDHKTYDMNKYVHIGMRMRKHIHNLLEISTCNRHRFIPLGMQDMINRSSFTFPSIRRAQAEPFKRH